MKSRSSQPSQNSGDLRWSVERRLTFVEERLFWLGEVQRPDLVARFGVSMSQASADIARYLAFKPRDVAYDKSAKRYMAGPDFQPVLAPPDALRYLGELRLVESGVLPAADTMIGVVPPFDATPLPERRIDPFVLRVVLRAIRERVAVSATYQSMSREKAARRKIEPHAIVYDGFRWHTRAFDHDSGDFRDFVLGRLSHPRTAESATSSLDDDRDWNTFVDLIIAPHPGLTAAQARAIALDYGIKGRVAKITVRRALLFYALKRLGLDHDPDGRPPNVQQIVLVNRAEVDATPGAGSQT